MNKKDLKKKLVAKLIGMVCKYDRWKYDHATIYAYGLDAVLSGCNVIHAKDDAHSLCLTFGTAGRNGEMKTKYLYSALTAEQRHKVEEYISGLQATDNTWHDGAWWFTAAPEESALQVYYGFTLRKSVRTFNGEYRYYYSHDIVTLSEMLPLGSETDNYTELWFNSIFEAKAAAKKYGRLR